LPYERGDLLSLFYERGLVESEDADQEGMHISGRVPSRLISYFEQFRVNTG
jgi:GTP-binding protein HflX